jgi:hypothetical protein|tara:strand:- start:35 stop:508 length:474 start_codon:yes stop_codon:yes gene_type:complete
MSKSKSKMAQVQREGQQFSATPKVLGVKTLSGVADKVGVTLQSLIKQNPNIKDPNKIGANQDIKLPIRKKTFVERNILGKKTGAPQSMKIKGDKKYQTEGGAKTKDFTYKKDAEGKVYEGMSKEQMSKLSKKAMGGKIQTEFRMGGKVNLGNYKGQF